MRRRFACPISSHSGYSVHAYRIANTHFLASQGVIQIQFAAGEVLRNFDRVIAKASPTLTIFGRSCPGYLPSLGTVTPIDKLQATTLRLNRPS